MLTIFVLFCQIEIHHEVNSRITRLYGITKDPKTENFMKVLKYTNDRNLREYPKTISGIKIKLEILRKIINFNIVMGGMIQKLLIYD